MKITYRILRENEQPEAGDTVVFSDGLVETDYRYTGRYDNGFYLMERTNTSTDRRSWWKLIEGDRWVRQIDPEELITISV